MASGNLSTKKRSKSGGGPIQKKARKSKKKVAVNRGKEVRREDTMMDPRPAVAKSGAEMREKDREYTELSSRFQEGLSVLKEKICRPDDKEHVIVERRAARLDTLVEIMTGVHAAGSADKVDKVKRAILDGLESSRNDIEFREALFDMFISCLGSSSAGKATGTTVPPALQPEEEAVQASKTFDSSASPHSGFLQKD